MTKKRIIAGKRAFYHVLNRVAGEPSDFPIDHAGKRYFLKLLHNLLELHGAHHRVISYCLMDNHFHLVLSSDPTIKLSLQEIKQRYESYFCYEDEPQEWDDSMAASVLKRMRSLSMFIGELQHRFTNWYNKVHCPEIHGACRRGSLWQQKFKSNIIEKASTMRKCARYIICNPLRAKMVSDPGHYQYSSWGVYKQTGKHPFERNFGQFIENFVGNEEEKYVYMKEHFETAVNRFNLMIKEAIDNQFSIERQRAMAIHKTLNTFDNVATRNCLWSTGGMIYSEDSALGILKNSYDMNKVHNHNYHQFPDKEEGSISVLRYHKPKEEDSPPPD